MSPQDEINERRVIAATHMHEVRLREMHEAAGALETARKFSKNPEWIKAREREWRVACAAYSEALNEVGEAYRATFAERSRTGWA